VPELPEVETVRRALEGLLVGRVVAAAELLRPEVAEPPDPRAWARLLAGCAVRRLERRGKHLALRLQGVRGEPVWLLVHLGMTGRLLWVPAGRRWVLPLRHTHAFLRVREPDGSAVGRLGFYDVRRFGRLRAVQGEEGLGRLGPLGVDPLLDAFDGGVLARRLRGRRAPIKALLLDQDLVAGLGNIYADEALHRAGIHPRADPRDLGAAAWDRLARAVVGVLREAVVHGGTTFADYRRPDGRPGGFARRLRVYGRAGKPCLACGAALQAERIAGRTTVFCPRCQPPRAGGPGQGL
jgi:formamidopyrimidine-DNA glycosylase